MPLSNILKSAAGTCPFCNQKAGILSREHSQCRRTHDAGFQEMNALAAEAGRTYSFGEKSLRLTLAGIAGRSHGDGTTVNLALEEGWKRGVAHSMADGILTQDEESRLREFRDRLALADSGTDRKAAEEIERAAVDRLTQGARLAAIAVDDPDTHLGELTQSLRGSALIQEQQTALLVRAWGAPTERDL